VNAVWPQRVGAERRSDRRVDPARDAHDDVVEAVLLDVVAKAHGQSEAHLFELLLERDDLAAELGLAGGGGPELDDLDDGDVLA
jgi:hypothetical protein